MPKLLTFICLSLVSCLSWSMVDVTPTVYDINPTFSSNLPSNVSHWASVDGELFLTADDGYTEQSLLRLQFSTNDLTKVYEAPVAGNLFSFNADVLFSNEARELLRYNRSTGEVEATNISGTLYGLGEFQGLLYFVQDQSIVMHDFDTGESKNVAQFNGELNLVEFEDRLWRTRAGTVTENGVIIAQFYLDSFAAEDDEFSTVFFKEQIINTQGVPQCSLFLQTISDIKLLNGTPHFRTSTCEPDSSLMFRINSGNGDVEIVHSNRGEMIFNTVSAGAKDFIIKSGQVFHFDYTKEQLQLSLPVDDYITELSSLNNTLVAISASTNGDTLYLLDTDSMEYRQIDLSDITYSQALGQITGEDAWVFLAGSPGNGTEPHYITTSSQSYSLLADIHNRPMADSSEPSALKFTDEQVFFSTSATNFNGKHYRLDINEGVVERESQPTIKTIPYAQGDIVYSSDGSLNYLAQGKLTQLAENIINPPAIFEGYIWFETDAGVFRVGTDLSPDLMVERSELTPRGWSGHYVVLGERLYFAERKRDIAGDAIEFLRWVDLQTNQFDFYFLNTESTHVVNFELVPFNQKIYFVQYFEQYGAELVVFDPATTTVSVKDLYPGQTGASPHDFFIYQDRLYFSTVLRGDNQGYFYSTDGETILDEYETYSQRPEQIVVDDSRLFYIQNNTLYVAKAGQHKMLVQDMKSTDELVARNHLVFTNGRVNVDGMDVGNELVRYDYNHLPDITLTASTEIAQEDDSVSVVLTATDFDEDTLLVEWSQTSGPITLNWSVQGDTLSFTAPAVTQRSDFEIMVSVDDGFATQTDSVSIQIEPTPAQPVVEPAASGGGAMSFFYLLVMVLALCWRKVH